MNIIIKNKKNHNHQTIIHVHLREWIIAQITDHLIQ